jgi:hypothetical protein
VDSGRRPRRGHTWRKLGDVNIDECAHPGPRLTSTDAAAATFPSGVSPPAVTLSPGGFRPPLICCRYICSTLPQSLRNLIIWSIRIYNIIYTREERKKERDRRAPLLSERNDGRTDGRWRRETEIKNSAKKRKN